MQKLSYLNFLGERIDFGGCAPFVFWKISGVEPPNCDGVYAQAAGVHGYIVKNIRLGKRTVKFFGHVHGDGEKELYDLRKRLSAAMSAALGIGEIIYENGSGCYKTAAFVKNFAYGVRSGGIQTVEVTFECPSPFWKTVERSVIKLAYVEGGVSFPLKFPSFFGTLGYRAVLKNEGNIPVPIVLSIGGGALNPKIVNKTTGREIAVRRVIDRYDKLIVDTDPENISAVIERIDPASNSLVRENAFGYLTYDSSMFLLEPGENEIVFTSDDENRRVMVEIGFYGRFAGV